MCQNNTKLELLNRIMECGSNMEHELEVLARDRQPIQMKELRRKVRDILNESTNIPIGSSLDDISFTIELLVDHVIDKREHYKITEEGPKIAEVAYISGQLGRPDNFKDLYDAYATYRGIYLDWAVGKGVQSDEESAYISTYAQRVLREI